MVQGPQLEGLGGVLKGRLDWEKCLLLWVVRLLLASLLRVGVRLLAGGSRCWVTALCWWSLIGHVGDSVLTAVHIRVVPHWHLVVPKTEERERESGTAYIGNN